PSSAVRQAAISALNSIGHPDMASRVAVLLKDPDPLIRESAVRIAGYFGYSRCADLLFERCRDENETVRGSAVESIVYLDDARVVPLLCETVRKDTPRVRAAAARALSFAEARDVLPCLLAALEDDDPWVRYFSARSIEKLDGGEIDGEDRDALVEILSRMVRSDEAHQVRIAAMAALSTVGGNEAIEILSGQVRTEDRDITRSALCALGRIPGHDSLAPILNVLRSGDPSLRLDAIHALKECREDDALGGLEWATMDKDPAVVRAAMEGLAHLGTREAVAVLIAMASDEARREAAVDAMSRMGADRVDFVAEGLSHADPGVRSSVVDVLARMKHQRATERLVEALHDSVASVRLAAIHSLKQLGSRQAEVLLTEIAHSDPDVAVRHAAKGTLRHNGF
ncbi:MAG: HEAT repeat domain-containing protein, partial [Acidobacteriota bacterium]